MCSCCAFKGARGQHCQHCAQSRSDFGSSGAGARVAPRALMNKLPVWRRAACRQLEQLVWALRLPRLHFVHEHLLRHEIVVRVAARRQDKHDDTEAKYIRGWGDAIVTLAK